MSHPCAVFSEHALREQMMQEVLLQRNSMTGDFEPCLCTRRMWVERHLGGLLGGIARMEVNIQSTKDVVCLRQVRHRMLSVIKHCGFSMLQCCIFTCLFLNPLCSQPPLILFLCQCGCRWGLFYSSALSSREEDI